MNDTEFITTVYLWWAFHKRLNGQDSFDQTDAFPGLRLGFLVFIKISPKIKSERVNIRSLL